ncbi:hypothetical protein JCM10213_007947 [Rhodosporidiobolus nylandii]
MDAHPLPPSDSSSPLKDSYSALSSRLLALGALTRPLDLHTLFLSPSLPSSASSKAAKKHHDTLILQARAREQLSKCLWGMLERREEEREVMEGLLAREAREAGERERERTMRERAEREREIMGRELEQERSRAREAEAKLKAEQERHRHAKDELAKMKSALQFVKTQALHDQKRRESEVTALHQRLQKLTTTSDSSFTRFVVLNGAAAASSSSGSPLNATFGGRLSRLSSTSGRSTPPASSSPSPASAALEAEVELLTTSLSAETAQRTHLEGENTLLREFVGEVGEWAETVGEMEEFKEAMQGEEGEELRALAEGAEGDESYMVPTPHLSLPVPALTSPLHRKLYAIRLGLSTLSSSSALKLTALREELEAELEAVYANVADEQALREEIEKENEQLRQEGEEKDELVREFVEKRAEGRRQTMARGSESDDDALPSDVAATLAAQKAAKKAATASKRAPAPPPPAAAAAASASSAPRPSEPPSASVAAFLSELGLDTPAAPAEALVSERVRQERQARFEKVTGSVERMREKKAVGEAPKERVRASIARSSIARPPAPAGGADGASSSSSSTRRTSASSRPSPSSSSSTPTSSASAPSSSSTLSSILALADSPPVASDPLVSKKVLAASAAVNSAPSSSSSSASAKGKEKVSQSDADRVRAKKEALLARARAGRA